MTRRTDPGQRLVRHLSAALVPGMEWSEAESATLDLIASQANRAATLQALLDAEIASDATRPRLVVELAGELRQHEQSVARLTATLQPSGTGPAKSTQHQAAALTRWNRAG
jgi:hypothetical protein